jgi:class 3 adenylate cyclase
MFCDLIGSTLLSTRFDPEDLREIVGAYHRCVADTVARFSECNNRDITMTPLFDREFYLEERASGSRSLHEYWARTPAESGKLLALERCLSRLPADRIQPRAKPAFQWALAPLCQMGQPKRSPECEPK